MLHNICIVEKYKRDVQITQYGYSKKVPTYLSFMWCMQRLEEQAKICDYTRLVLKSYLPVYNIQPNIEISRESVKKYELYHQKNGGT